MAVRVQELQLLAKRLLLHAPACHWIAYSPKTDRGALFANGAGVAHIIRVSASPMRAFHAAPNVCFPAQGVSTSIFLSE